MLFTIIIVVVLEKQPWLIAVSILCNSILIIHRLSLVKHQADIR